MKARLDQRLQQLSEAVGVSGEEREVRKLILSMIRDHVEAVTIDPMGNITALRRGTGESPLRVMVSAHMDEIGFMVKSCENGLAGVLPIGAHDGRFAAAKRVTVGKSKTPGVLMWAALHQNQSRSVVNAEDMTIDLGKSSAAVGERAAYVGKFAVLSDSTVRGKAFDSRAACAALIALLEPEGDPLPVDLAVAFTVQEHIGGRGAAVAANRLKPDAAFVLRGTECNDLPLPAWAESGDSRLPVIRLGGGPALSAVDPLYIADRALVDHVRNTAEAGGFPYQIDALGRSRGGLARISASGAGVPAAALGIPVRYAKSPNGLVNLNDIDSTVRLLRQTLAALTPETLER